VKDGAGAALDDPLTFAASLVVIVDDSTEPYIEIDQSKYDGAVTSFFIE